MLEYVRIRSRRIGYNLSEAGKFCYNNKTTGTTTRLEDCKTLDWSKIITLLKAKCLTGLKVMEILNVGDRKGQINNEITFSGMMVDLHRE